MEGFIEGTIDDITFYKMGGAYYARMKSSLTGKKFWKHKSFEGSRRSCSRFGRGNALASVVYNEIEEEKREYALFCRMKSVAIRMIKEGFSEEEVVEELRKMKPEERIWEFENLKMWQLGEEYVAGRDIKINKTKGGEEKVKYRKVKKIISQFDNSTIRKWGKQSVSGRNFKRGKIKSGEVKGERVKSERERSIWQFDNSTMRQWGEDSVKGRNFRRGKIKSGEVKGEKVKSENVNLVRRLVIVDDG